jgi:hypothetical protein
MTIAKVHITQDWDKLVSCTRRIRSDTRELWERTKGMEIRVMLPPHKDPHCSGGMIWSVYPEDSQRLFGLDKTFMCIHTLDMD